MTADRCRAFVQVQRSGVSMVSMADYGRAGATGQRNIVILVTAVVSVIALALAWVFFFRGGDDNSDGDAAVASKQTDSAAAGDAGAGEGQNGAGAVGNGGELNDASIEVPRRCFEATLMERYGEYSHEPVSFKAGVATSEEPNTGRITIKSVQSGYGVEEEGELTVVQFECTPKDDEPFDSLGLYTKDRKYLDGVEWGDTTLPELDYGTKTFTDVRAEADAFYATVKEIGVAGDDVAAGGPRTGVAHFRFEFNDTYSRLRVREARYETSVGEVTAPEVDDAVDFFQALRDGDDAAVLEYMTKEQLDEVKTGCVGGCDDPKHKKYSEVFLQKDADIAECFLAAPKGFVYYESIDGFEFVGGEPEFKAGQFFCPILMPSDGEHAWERLLLLQPDDAGSFEFVSLVKTSK